jgi:hypothetical protein
MALRKLFTSLAFLAAFAPLTVLAQAAETPDIDRIQAFLIYEDTGKLSKDLSGVVDQIIANDENGTSIQMLVNVVLKSKPNQLYENGPVLHVRVTPATISEVSPVPVPAEYYITYIAAGGELVRSVIVDHNCDGFELEAFIEVGGKRTSAFKKSFSVTCGD